MKHSPEGVPEAKTIPGSMGEYPHLTLEESNTIQLLLIKRYLATYPKEFNGDLTKAGNVWAQAYGDVFQKLFKDEPDLVDFFHEDPKRCVALITEKLYSHTIQ